MEARWGDLPKDIIITILQFDYKNRSKKRRKLLDRHLKIKFFQTPRINIELIKPSNDFNRGWLDMNIHTPHQKIQFCRDVFATTLKKKSTCGLLIKINGELISGTKKMWINNSPEKNHLNPMS